MGPAVVAMVVEGATLVEGVRATAAEEGADVMVGVVGVGY